MKQSEVYNTVNQMRLDGETFSEIGRRFGFSRQRAHQIYYRAATSASRKLATSCSVGAPHLSELAKHNMVGFPIEFIANNIGLITKMSSDSRNRYREIVRLRDKCACQVCGIKWSGGRRFDVHHINGTVEDTKRVDKNWENMITLCHRCHLIEDAHKMCKKADK